MTKNFPDYAGLRKYTKSQQTGHYVGVYNGEEAGLDTSDGVQPWSTVCEPHGMIISHETLSLAIAHSSAPLEWCEVCQAEQNREPGCTCTPEWDSAEQAYTVAAHAEGCPTTTEVRVIYARRDADSAIHRVNEQYGTLAWCGMKPQFRHSERTGFLSEVNCSRCLTAIKQNQPKAWRS